MIYIHKGDDTDFNDNSFLTFNIVTEKDLTNWQAKFILNGLEKTFEDITSKSFQLHFSDEETSQFKLGKTTNELRLIDEEGKIKTVAKNIEIYVTSDVIENESQLINLPILRDEGIDINISLVNNNGGSGGTVNHFELLYRDMANQHPISAITSLQETLDNKANKDEIPNVDVFITKEELENKGYLTEHQDISNLATKDELTNKQDTLISGTNIKTINNQSILGDGNITIAGQWVAKQTLLVDGSASAYLSMSPGQKRTFDLSDYLPKDDKLYEVMMSGSIQSGTAQGNHTNLLVGSSYFGDINFCRSGLATNFAIFTSGNAIIVVGNDRQIYVSASGGSNGVGQIDFLKLIGYREVK